MSCTTFCTTIRVTNAFKYLPAAATLNAISLCNCLNLPTTFKALQPRVQIEKFWCPSVLSADILSS